MICGSSIPGVKGRVLATRLDYFEPSAPAVILLDDILEVVMILALMCWFTLKGAINIPSENLLFK